MFDWLLNIIDMLSGYVLDFFVWLLEFVFWIFDTILRFLWALARPFIVSALEEAAKHLSSGLIDTIADAYAWFQYVNEWIPLQYAIGLFLAYYSISSTLYCFRVFISLFPVGRV